MKKDKTIFIVDFGLAKEYIDHDTNKHIPYRYSFILILIISAVIFWLIRCVGTYLRTRYLPRGTGIGPAENISSGSGCG